MKSNFITDMGKKRLLVFHPTIAPYRVDLFNDLNRSFDATICFCAKFLNFKDTSKIDRLLKYTPVYLKQKKGDIYHAKNSEYIRMIKETNPDIVITGEFSLNTVIALLYRWLHRKHYKVVSICDDSYDMIVNNNDFSIKHRIVRKIVAPFLDNLILVEPNVVNWYQQHYHKGIWFPIIRDDDRARKIYERLLPESQKVIDAYHLNGKHVFLFVGRLVTIKNVKSIIRAFQKLNDENSVLVIIGSGEEEENLHNEAKGMLNVIFTGRLEDNELYKWYNVATAFILASYQEAFGAVTNEALLAGCWAIISKRAGSQCLVKPGVNGDVFDPMDVEELASKMKNVCNSLPSLQEHISLRANGMLWHYKDLLEKIIIELNK